MNGQHMRESVAELGARYRASGDPRLRDQLALSLAPMVKYIVYRKLREIPVRCEVEDFISCGLEALLGAIDRFDPERGTTIEQFAWTRIHGAVLDELRRGDWAPRSLRRWERDLQRARDQFTGLYGRPPSRHELADAVGVSIDRLDALTGDLARAGVGSLNVLVLGDEETTTERIDTLPSEDADLDPERHAMLAHAKQRFRAVFETLPVRERQVAVLLYVHNLNLRETGEIIGVSESRVCQIHGELRRRLREGLAAAEELFEAVA